MCCEELISFHRHDYQTCSCPNYTMTDGGLDYLRYGGVDTSKVESLCVYLDDPYDIVRVSYHWGTRGKSGKDPLKMKTLSELSNSHIEEIIKMLENYNKDKSFHHKLMKDELKYRKEKGIFVND